MSTTIVMFQGQHAFVDQYYADGRWHPVEPWEVREGKGEPAVIAHATTDPHRPGRAFLTRDVRTGPVYDETTCLTGYSSDGEVPFEELEAVAGELGWGEAFDRRVLVFRGGPRPLRPALISGAGLQPFSSHWDGDFWEAELRKRGYEGVLATGEHAVVFEWPRPAVDGGPQAAPVGA